MTLSKATTIAMAYLKDYCRFQYLKRNDPEVKELARIIKKSSEGNLG